MINMDIVKVGDVCTGRVVLIRDYGADVEIRPGVEGLLHISELREGYVSNVTDVVDLNDIVRVKVIKIDDIGRIKLSRRALLGGEESAASTK